MRLGDLDELKEAFQAELSKGTGELLYSQTIMNILNNTPTVDLWEMRQEATENALKKAEVLYKRPQGKWITFDELRGWLTAQGFSSGTVEDKVKEFKRYIERAREDE